jgi:hypothetical protein
MSSAQRGILKEYSTIEEPKVGVRVEGEQAYPVNILFPGRLLQTHRKTFWKSKNSKEGEQRLLRE